MRITFIACLALLAPIGCCLSPLGLAPEESEPAPAVVEALPPPLAAPPPPPAVVAAPPGRLGASSFDVLTTRAPQASGLRELYERARAPREGTIEGGMLVCRARVNGGGYDDGFFAGGADVALAVRFGDTTIRSTAQSGLRTYSFPIAHLEPGDDVWIRVVDRDVFVDDVIAEGTVRYERAPFSLRMGQADVECRAVDPATVARRTRDATLALGRAVDGLEGVEPDVQSYDVGYPRERAARVIAAAEGALAWTDASHDAYRQQIDRATAFDDEWQRRASAAVRDASDRLPPPDSRVRFGPGRRVSVGEMACGTDALALAESMAEASIDARSGGCFVVVRMEVERGTSLPSLTRPEAQWEAWALDASGNMLAARVVARRQDGIWLAADQSVTVGAGQTVDVVLSLPAGSDPLLLRVRDGGRPAVLRLP